MGTCQQKMKLHSLSGHSVLALAREGYEKQQNYRGKQDYPVTGEKFNSTYTGTARHFF